MSTLYRESPMTKPEARLYKDQIRTNKNIHDTLGTGLHLLYHNESKPLVRPASANKMAAGMLTNSWSAYKEKE